MINKKNYFNVRTEKNSQTGLIIAEIWDDSERYLPDFTPDWLYDILENIGNSSGGHYEGLMESVFEIDNTFYNNLITHPRCKSHEEINT